MSTKKPIDIGTLIFRKETAGGGFRTCVESGVSVKCVVLHHRAGKSVEKILADNSLLTPAQVYAALAYYHANTAEIEQAIAEDERAEREGAAAARAARNRV